MAKSFRNLHISLTVRKRILSAESGRENQQILLHQVFIAISRSRQLNVKVISLQSAFPGSYPTHNFASVYGRGKVNAKQKKRNKKTFVRKRRGKLRGQNYVWERKEGEKKNFGSRLITANG
jgi:hypothetical protein